MRLIWLEEEQEKMMKVQLEEAIQSLTDLRMLVASNKEVQARTESLLQARLVTLQTGLAQSKARHNKPPVPGVTDQATSCTTFPTLYSLAGQLDLLCMWGQGSKWVMVRPSILPTLTEGGSSSSWQEVDSRARKELLKQTKMDIDTILDMEGGQEFVTKLVKGEEDVT